MTQAASHNPTYSIAKAICIILMVVGHSGAPEWLVHFIYNFHMPCFFIISGYFITDKHVLNLKRSIKRRFSSIWWYAFKWSVIFILLHNVFVRLHIVNDPFSIEQMLIKLLTAMKLGFVEIHIATFWFLADLFYASIFSLLILHFIRKRFPAFNPYKYMWVAILALLICGGVMTGNGLRVPLFKKTFFLSWAFVLTGMYVRQWVSKTSVAQSAVVNSRWTAYIGLAFIAVISFFYGGGMEVDGWHYVPYYALALIGSFAIIKLSSMIAATGSRIVPALDIIGCETLIILTFHTITLKAVSYLKVLYYDMPIEKLVDFPVIKDNNEVFWIIYTIIGLAVPLAIIYVKRSIAQLRQEQKQPA